MKNNGLTLIEMVIVMLLLLILSPIAANIIIQEFRTFYLGQNFIKLDGQGRLALNRMTRDLRAASSFSTANVSTLTFNDRSGSTITYALSGSQLLRSGQVLTDDVQNLTFGYYDSTGSTTTNTSAIRYVTTNLTIEKLSTNFNIGTATYLWNMIN